MYDLKHSFIKGVDKGISNANRDHISYISENCGVIDNIVTGKQIIFVPQRKCKIEHILLSNRSVTLIERADDFLFIKTYDLRNNLESVGQFEIAFEKGIHSHANIVGVAIEYDEMEEKLLVLLIPSEKTHLCLRRIHGELLCECQIDTGVTEHFCMSVTSFDSSVICIQSQTKFWFYRCCYSPSSQKFTWKLLNIPMMPVDDGEIITSHASIILECHVTFFTTNKGRIFVTESGIVQSILQTDHPITCLEKCHNMLLVGCSSSLILVYSISINTNDKCIVELQSKIDVTCGIPNSIICCSPSMDQQSAYITVKSGFNESDIAASQIAKLEYLDGKWKINVAAPYLMDVCHKDTVITSCSIQNGILAVVAMESLVLIDEKGVMTQCYTMKEMPISISVHPSGHQILLGFEDEVRCDHILNGELKTFWRMPRRNIFYCSFNKNGEKFGVINDCAIVVVDFISGDVLQELRHSSRVLKFIWLPDHIHLISHNDEGVLYLWNTFSGEKENECVRFKGSLCMDYIAPCLDNFWLNLDESLQVLSSKTFDTLNVIMDNTNSERVTMMTSSHQPSKFVIAIVKFNNCSSTEPLSNIRLYKFGIAEYIQVPLYDRVTGISLSSDDRLLHVFMSKGTLMVFEVSSPFPNNNQQESSFGRNILVSDSYFQEKETIEVELKALLKEEETKHRYHLELLSLANQDEIARRSEELSKMVNAQVAKLEALQMEQQRLHQQHQSNMEQNSRLYQEQLHHLEMEFLSKMEKVSLVRTQKQLDFNRQIEENERRKGELNHQYTNKRKALEDEFEMELSRWNEKIQKEEERHDRVCYENQETVIQTEYDIDQQVQSTMTSLDYQRDQSRERILKATSDNAILSKKITSLQRTIEERVDLIKLLLQRQEELKERTMAAERTLKEHEEELERQHQLVQSKSNEILSMQKNQIKLEQSNEMYQQRVDDLKKELDASHNMDDLKSTVKIKENKIVELEREIENIKRKINDLCAERNVAHEELKRHRERHSVVVHQYESIQGDLQEILSSLDVRSTMKKLESIYLFNDAVEKLATVDSSSLEIHQEKESSVSRDDEVESLQQEFKNVKKEITCKEIAMEEESQRKLKENQKLLEDITQCRLNLKQIRCCRGV